jgi:hypothetical protein
VIFLVEYDRKKGRLLHLREFEDDHRLEAEDARLDLELSLRRASLDREVVLLEAASVDALKKTHKRYFEDLHGLLVAQTASAKAAAEK